MARIEDHAARLHDGVEAVFAKGPVDELSFVGHSLGGLVIQEYLRSGKARQPAACVYIATPHRGAVLCDLRKNWFLFRLAMGDKAALQLSPGDAFHRQPLPLAAISGAIVGDLGDGNASIPGHDDGTVAVGEATLPGALATVTLACGHTSIAWHPETARQVLTFLRTRAFAPITAVR
jgi:pimeloyl-ACP methyl ester carboxylesterase